jgi:hypothetical protein
MLRAARLSHFDVTLLFEVTDSSCWSDDGSSLVAADARTERIGAKPSRAVVARGLRHTVLTYEDSAGFGTQQEAKMNSLVTMTGTASSSTRCPVRPFLGQSAPELPAHSGEIYAGLFAGASLL